MRQLFVFDCYHQKTSVSKTAAGADGTVGDNVANFDIASTGTYLWVWGIIDTCLQYISEDRSLLRRGVQCNPSCNDVCGCFRDVA